MENAGAVAVGHPDDRLDDRRWRLRSEARSLARAGSSRFPRARDDPELACRDKGVLVPDRLVDSSILSGSAWFGGNAPPDRRLECR